MGTSPLARTGEEVTPPPPGHGTAALGPSDRSDTGSDTVGGPGFGLDIESGMGTTSDLAAGGETAGADLGDSNLDSDTDSSGTGERQEAGRDLRTEAGADIDVDRIVGADEAGVVDHPPRSWEDASVDDDEPKRRH
ncbi:MAG TPA: chemotaxis protein [Burkholderiaceae bacterium]|nr:chemotaxis protein [Burkholderiaceae bacterium]